MITLSASSLHRAERCPASASLPRIESASNAMERGKELHADEAAKSPEGAEVAFAYDVETGRARILGTNLDRQYGELAPTEIAGSTDKLTVEPDRVIIKDYKSGYSWHVEPSRNIQLGFYAVAACAAYDRSAARVELDFLDRGMTLPADLDAFDLANIRERIRSIWTAANAASPRVVKGDHCTSCPCIQRCPAYLELACAVATGISPSLLPGASEGLTAETVASGWRNLEALKKLMGEAEKAYRGFASLWPVPLGDGRTLMQREVVRDELDGTVTWQILRDLHGSAVADAAVQREATKTSVEAALAEIAPPRGKASMVREVMKAIEEANGILKKRTMRVDAFKEE